MLADSSVWIDFFNGRVTPATTHLRSRVGVSDLYVGDFVMTEVLQGFRSDSDYRAARFALLSFRAITIVDRQVALDAADHYRMLRARGITPRKTIDTLIATRCIIDGIPLIFSDRDFQPFVEHCGLIDAMAT